MDYVARGHWYSEYELTTQVPAWYCGAPEQTKFEEKAGRVLVVELKEGRATVHSREVGALRWLVRDIDVGLRPPGRPLESELAALAGPDTILRARLKGTWPQDSSPDIAGLEEECAGDFFHLEVDDSGTAFPLELEEVDELFAAGTVGARFVEGLRGRIAEGLELRMGEVLGRITGGKYSRVRIDGNLEVSVYSPEKDAYMEIKDDRSLWGGTRDQVFLAARIAFLELIAGGTHPPLLMDDTFCSFDDMGRKERAFEMLATLAERTQILYFTCQESPESLPILKLA